MVSSNVFFLYGINVRDSFRYFFAYHLEKSLGNLQFIRENYQASGSKYQNIY